MRCHAFTREFILPPQKFPDIIHYRIPGALTYIEAVKSSPAT